MSTTIGRLTSAEVGKTHVDDNASKTVQALMSKMDEMIVAIKAITAKLDGDSGVNLTNYASACTDSLAKIELTI